MDEFFGIARRVATYRTHESKWRRKEFNQAYENAHNDLSAHASHWPYDDDDYIVVNTAWWVGMAQTRVEHFTSLCSGDEKTARYLMSIYLRDTQRMPVRFSDPPEPLAAAADLGHVPNRNSSASAKGGFTF